MRSKLDEMLELVARLKKLARDMEARGDRLPAEAEELFSTIEEIVNEMAKETTPTIQ